MHLYMYINRHPCMHGVVLNEFESSSRSPPEHYDSSASIVRGWERSLRASRGIRKGGAKGGGQCDGGGWISS
eukprot:COSAG02_NODE_3858_length_6134_cov_6.287016_3_plen_72_part_00